MKVLAIYHHNPALGTVENPHLSLKVHLLLNDASRFYTHLSAL